MTARPSNIVRWLALTLALSLTALALLALACGPSAPAGQDGGAQGAMPTATAAPTPAPDHNQKLDITMAGLTARHQAKMQGAAVALADPLLAEPADAFIRVSQDIGDTRTFLETNGAAVSVARGSDDGYILAKVPVSLIERVAQRTEVTEVSSGVVAYMDPLVKFAIAHHEAGKRPGEKILVHLEVPFTYNNYFLGRDKGVEAVAANLDKLRGYLDSQEDVEITKDSGESGNFIRAKVPFGLLNELSEMPFVDAIMTNEPSVPGLTFAESSKIIHLQLAEIMTAHAAGVPLPDDPNYVNNLMIEVIDGMVRIAIRTAGEDAATDTANGQFIIDFLTENGGSGQLENDTSIGPYVWGVVPVPVMAPLLKLPEVQAIYIIPPGDGPVAPLKPYSTLDGDPKPRGAVGNHHTDSGVETVAAVTSEGKDWHGAKAWHDAGVTGSGVKIGVVDVGFHQFAPLMGVELPPQHRVHIRCFTGDLVWCN